MGYLNNTIVTVDAILTTTGRQLLAQNDGTFRITQFALADDEIDYTLYNPTNPSGSAYYGQAIENMPLLEAFAETTQTMKYKLVTLPRGTARLPILSVPPSISLLQGASQAISPQTLNYLGANTVEPSGYTSGVTVTALNVSNSTTTLGTTVSQTVVGTVLNLRATTVNTLFQTYNQLQATLTIVGRDSGARQTIPVTVTKTA